MTDTTTPAAHATAAAEAVRALNHATLGPGRDGWEYPSDAYDVIGGLDRMAGGLPQALDQVWALVGGLAADGYVRSDRGDASIDLADARTAIEDAKTALEMLSNALNRAHSATAPLSSTND
ncbi:hypothetical protein OG530_40990 (plasmid) [Streptomyces decoyicus]|uniref:hypothetical protein n=1 Tax=Streptomyces decoyicus TaxID=249567 RepID=UPI002E1876A3